SVAALLLTACPRAPELGGPGGAGCTGLTATDCGRARGFLSAASAFGNVRHEYLLDPTSAMVPGRGVERSDSGSFAVLPTRCASERVPASSSSSGSASPSPSSVAAKVDASTVDFSYIGVAVDQALVAADADLAPWLSAGGEASERRISLIAVA